MKANLVSINFSTALLGLASAFMLGSSAFAQTAFLETAQASLPVSNAPTSELVVDAAKLYDDEGVPYSALGVKTGLPLYDKDKSDTCVPGALQIRVTVHNVTPEGLVKLEMFGEKNFMKSKGKLRRIRVPAEEGAQRICINLPAPGRFAVVGYHDKNGDRRLKKAWNFKPLEPYGLSNNPEIQALRLPKFSETGFDVPLHGADIDINFVDLTL